MGGAVWQCGGKLTVTKELLIHKANVEQILGKEPEHEDKKNEHNRG